jgi:D-3-phosphoglycerate dehydrogenase
VCGIEVRFAGEGEDLLRPLAAGAVIGVLEGAIGAPAVNVVNALHLARQRGIQVERTRVDAPRDYPDLIELKLQTATSATRVAGALLGEGHPRVVKIDDFRVDVIPRGMLVVLRNRDVPGVIGRVGTLLGNAGINIAEYHQARVAAGGDALAAISVDARLPGPVLESLRALPEVRSAAMVDLGE